MAMRSMLFWPRPATTSGSLRPGSGLCAPFSGRLSWSGMTRAALPPHTPERPSSLFHRRPSVLCRRARLPGTDLTFFDWPVGPERRGTGSIVRTSLRVAGEDALRWWGQRFGDVGVEHSGAVERDGRETLDFEDFEGQRLSLVDDAGAGPAHPWEKSLVPPAHQIRGLGPITLSVPDAAPTERLLTKVMDLRRERDFSDGGRTVHVFAMGH